MRVAVIGASGCMGRRTVAAFADRGDDVIAIARRPDPGVPARQFLPLDVASAPGDELARLFTTERVDAVVNAALGWDAELYSANVELTEHLLDALRHTPSRPRLVQLGTIHEYGPVPRGTRIDEHVPPRPEQPYPRAKLTATRLVLEAAQHHGVDAVVLRLTNTIGPEPASASFFGSLAVRLRDDREAVDLKIADARRDYVDSRDAAEAVVRAVTTVGAHGVFNIGSGRARHIQTLVDALVRAADRPPEAVRCHTGDVHSQGSGWIEVDSTRATDLLGWRPHRSLDDSMRTMWDTVAARSGAGTAPHGPGT